MADPVFQAPKGTRDVYPIDAARRRFITEHWRRTSIAHGFEEVDGPTFEHLDLYTVKSGDGIVSELFSFRRDGGEKDYALRPEFTPTLARLYAARAATLPRPTKWFTTGAFFRAERPQRGRLREFLQWNCDVIGLPPHDDKDPSAVTAARAVADAEVIACCVDLLASIGLTPTRARVRLNDRAAVSKIIPRCRGGAGAPLDDGTVLSLIDKRAKLAPAEFAKAAAEIGFDPAAYDALMGAAQATMNDGASPDDGFASLRALMAQLTSMGIAEWCQFDPNIARGLAYYTGVVFEVTVDGERAVAGGGRYDNLVELFGGPSTPAVGFGMGDAVLALILQDAGLMPTDDALLEFAGLRPDVFVISNGQPESDTAAASLIARLRRGGLLPLARPLHVRRPYKATKNVGKLLRDAADARARVAVIVESATEATVKNLADGQQARLPIESLAAHLHALLSRGPA